MCKVSNEPRPCACGCGKWFMPNSNIQKYCSKRCYRLVNALNSKSRKQEPKVEVEESGWAIPTPPNLGPVPDFTKGFYKMFFELKAAS